MALLSHESAMEAWPAAGANEQGEKPRLSWRVHILPYLERQSLYEQFHLDEPWDSEHNKTLIQTMPEVFKSPGFELEDGKTAYLAVTGPHAAFSGPEPIAGGRIGHTGTDDVRDGLSQTLMVVEASPDQAVTWTQPDDWEFDPADPRKGLQSVRRGGFLALAADCAVHRIPDTVDDETLRRLFTRDDGQPDRLVVVTARVKIEMIIW